MNINRPSKKSVIIEEEKIAILICNISCTTKNKFSKRSFYILIALHNKASALDETNTIDVMTTYMITFITIISSDR